MSALAHWLARLTWFWILQLMRKPGMRRAQLMPMKWMRGERAIKFYRSHVRQNMFARKIGLRLLIISYTFLLASLILQCAFQAVMFMNYKGWLSPTALENRREYSEP